MLQLHVLRFATDVMSYEVGTASTSRRSIGLRVEDQFDRAQAVSACSCYGVGQAKRPAC